MSVGLTLEDNNSVTVVFLEDSVCLTLKNNPELISSGIIHKHIETLILLKHRIIVEKDTFEKLSKENVKYDNVEIMDLSQIENIISSGDVVITY